MDRSRPRLGHRAGFLAGLTRLSAAVVALTTTWLALTGSLVLGEALTRAATPPERADAIVVLGAAAYGRRPSPVYRERLRHALALYQRGKAPVLVVTGGKRRASDLSEAEVGRRWLIARGVPASAVLLEDASRSTAENLTFARDVLRAKGLGSTIVVSDPLHLARARLIGYRAGLDVQTSATPTTRFRSLRTQIPFLLRECGFLTSALAGIGPGARALVAASPNLGL